MEIYVNPPKDQWPSILARPGTDFSGLRDNVHTILEAVRSGGDGALKEYSLAFDKVEVREFQLSANEIRDSGQQISESLKEAIAIAQSNIERFHKSQKPEDLVINTMPGVECRLKYRPIEKVGLYIPGGTAPLLSTVLMLGIPARIAGCREIILCTPPNADGRIHPAILYCAGILGIENIYRIGGAQAIAAMAYGTESIPKMDKIFGPGNQYVTVAKQLVSLENVAIDLPAGPSEVAVIADNTADPAFIAADLLSQAEHGTDSQVILVATREKIITKVMAELDKQLATLPRKKIAEAALRNSRLIVMEDKENILDMINSYAPEHLIIQCQDYEEVGNRINNAGSVFLGPYTPESAGDYASGTNHTLPTGGYARAYSGIGLESFMKRISYQEISEDGLTNLGPAIKVLAEEEELMAHSIAVDIRLRKLTEKC
ncbi:MAG: histidinol dehydrogenase [Bacteroidales bacterium]|nr:histidinol dehydrogenase [Bacteroidales bacterium]